MSREPRCRAACVLLLRDDGALLMQHRDDSPTISFPGCWSIPGGAIEPDETALDAAARELVEETGYFAAPAALRLFYVQIIREPDGSAHEHNLYLLSYDGVQPVRCFEGQEMRWMQRAEAARLELVPGQAEMLAVFGALAAHAAGGVHG